MIGRTGIQAAALAALLTGIAIWSAVLMISARARAAEAQRGLDEVRRSSLAIEGFRRRPTLAADRERLSGEMTGLIEKQAGAAGIGLEKLTRISPEPPQRVCETSYQEKPTAVALRGVTMEQVVRFLHGISSADAALNVKSVRLTPPGENSPSGGWSAEIVLTYLIYSPRSLP